MSSNPIRVYIDSPPWLISKSNTDWALEQSLVYLSDFQPLELTLGRDHWFALRTAAHTLWSAVTRRIGLPIPRGSSIERRLRLPNDRIDLIYSHGKAPIPNRRKPVVWFYGVVDPDMQARVGITGQEIETQYAQFRRTAQYVDYIQLATRSSLARHQVACPEISDKFLYAPFFLPHITTVMSRRGVIEKHSDDSRVRILFVGREAHRKGLDIICQAIHSLPTQKRSIIDFTVITPKRHWSLCGEPWSNLKLLEPTSHSVVLNHMAQAHILAVPSRFETFGLVYLEAMASGCAVICPDFEAQVEITALGTCGLNSAPDAVSVASALDMLLERTSRVELALRATDRVSREYAATAAAAHYYAAFRHALAHSR